MIEKKNEIAQEHGVVTEWQSKKASSLELKFIQEKKEIEPSRPLLGGGMSEPKHEYVAVSTCEKGALPQYYATLSAATGAINEMLSTHLLMQARSASPNGAELNFIAESIASALLEIKPRDPIEGMLVTQLVALHNQMMHFMEKASHTIYGPEIDLNINRFSKINRCYLSTLDTLMRHRKQGAHTIRVEHVNINEGGQAMIGSFSANTHITPKN